ncbi:hypothetical protein AWV80_13000 [Cupriavidus sp. UYMU48A]|nr:hypothetical protein AWV80_13000 [Cupriavidus sp. UYMU48A]
MKSSRSLPAVKISSLPRIRITRTALSSSAARSASAMAWYIAAVMAFFFSARSNSIVRMPWSMLVLMLMDASRGGALLQ